MTTSVHPKGCRNCPEKGHGQRHFCANMILDKCGMPLRCKDGVWNKTAHIHKGERLGIRRLPC